ncbi:hypothetical protein AB1Y20_000385 [Prymnesium parvum]|uniref:Uncharacterized protein n=1 Tax=Prymnesium parvum TaxID=97485 RepID=A0AB34K7Z0_PRYPA
MLALLSSASLAAPALAAPAASQTASHVCVYNDVAAVISFKLRDVQSGAESASTSHFPVWQTKCLPAAAVGSPGSAIVPVVDAVLGRQVLGNEQVLEDPVSVSSVTYKCKGTTLDYSCEIGAPGPSPGDVAKEVGQFLLGFGKGIALETGFASCVTDVSSVISDIKAIVDFFESGFNSKQISSIVRAFELVGELLKDIGDGISACVSDAKELVQKIKAAATALSGNVLEIVKIVLEDAVRIFHDRKELTTDCKSVSADWKANDFEGSGEALGMVVGIIISDIDSVVEAKPAPLGDVTPAHAVGQCAKSAYMYCCAIGAPCDCSKGTTAPGQCTPESYAFCCDVGTPCDCGSPGEASLLALTK